MPPRRIHVDTDPGLDDLLALAIAFGCADLEVVGVTTVAGNAGLEQVSENAQRFLALTGEDVPMGVGLARPLALEPVDAAHVHGPDGRRGIPIPALDRRARRPAREVLLSSLGEHGAEAIVALGPLSNVADLVQHAPQALHGADIVWMGGALGPGNATPVAEFNCWADPHAAAVVLGEGALAARSVRIVPLDVTSEVRLFRHELPCFASGPRGRLVSDVLDALIDAERPVEGPCAVLHDPCAVLAAADAELFRWSRTVLAVEVAEGRERGRLSERPFGFGPKVHCASEVHREELWRRALASLRSFSGDPA